MSDTPRFLAATKGMKAEMSEGSGDSAQPRETFAQQESSGGAIAQESSVAAGEDGIAIQGDVNAPVVRGDNNIVGNVYGNIVQTFVKQVNLQPLLLTLWEGACGVIRLYSPLVMGLVILEIALLILFVNARPRYLTPDWVYMVLATVLVGVMWLWYRLWRHMQTGLQPLILAVGLTIVWATLFGWQVVGAAFPSQFAPQQFGIAIATLGEGPNFHMTSRSRQLTGLLRGHIDNVIDQTPDLADKVALRTIGVVTSSDDGREVGERIGAKLVLWGQLLEAEEDAVIYFQLLEMPNLTDDPVHPLIMPITPPAISIQLPIPDRDQLGVERIASEMNVGLTAFSLGLFYYVYELRPWQAVTQFELARKFLEKSATEHDLDPAESNLGFVYYYLGKGYQLLGQYELSQENLEKAAELSPDDPAILLGQAYNFGAFGDIAQREAALRQAIALTQRYPPDDVSAIFDRAVAYEGLEEYDSALREYRALLRVHPDFFIAYLTAARIHVRFQEYEQAQVLYEQARILAEEDAMKLAWLYVDEATLAAHLGHNEEAVRAYQQAIALNPTLVTAHYYLALVYESMGDLDAAEQTYQQVRVVSDTPGWALEVFAQFLARVHQPDRAIEQYMEALRYPRYNNALLYTNLALAYVDSDPQRGPQAERKALSALEEALPHPGPDESYIRSVYGNTLYHFGHIEEAIIQLDRVIAQSDGSAVPVRMNLARMYYETEDYIHAREMFQSVIDLEPTISPAALETALEGMRQAEEMLATQVKSEG